MKNKKSPLGILARNVCTKFHKFEQYFDVEHFEYEKSDEIYTLYYSIFFGTLTQGKFLLNFEGS